MIHPNLYNVLWDSVYKMGLSALADRIAYKSKIIENMPSALFTEPQTSSEKLGQDKKMSLMKMRELFFR